MELKEFDNIQLKPIMVKLEPLEVHLTPLEVHLTPLEVNLDNTLFNDLELTDLELRR